MTVVRNGLSNGYPFVEAILAALPLCDEILVSDGYSDDGTYNVLQRLAAARPQVHLTRDHWLVQGAAGEPFRRILETVRERVKGSVIFQFDANEVLPPENVTVLKE
ncbi:MAG: glycosyltransferase, partial [Thermoplasmata archaeon]|nr:glycosyltransferase [Thermoplasmata archaeon]